MTSTGKQLRVNEKAAVGFGEGTNDFYDKVRPIYPAAALQHLVSTLPPSKPLNILELGSGTGLFSRLLLSPPPPSSTIPSTPAGTLPVDVPVVPFPNLSIASLIAVEPSSGMRTAWNKGLVGLRALGWKKGEGQVVETVEGGFDDLSAAKELMGAEWKADLIVIAQAWHWAHPEYDAGIKEMETMLAPDGIISFIWNFERQEAPWNRAIRAIEASHEADSPQQHKGWWLATFDGEVYKAKFKEMERNKFWWNQTVMDDYIPDRCFSKSYMTVLSPEEKEQTKKDILEMLAREDSGKTWVDKEKGTFVLPWETDVIIMRRR